MSNIIIPGVSNSQMDTRRMVDELMEVERRPVERLENTRDQYQAQRLAWQDIGRHLNTFRTSATRLYGFESPFAARIAHSSDPASLTAEASRTAQEDINSIEVLQIARADSFASKQLPSDYRIEAGRYGFQVGEQQQAFEFRGGNLSDFAAAVNRHAGSLLRARVVRDTAQTQIIAFESRHEGLENRLSFTHRSEQMALDMGVIAPSERAGFGFELAGASALRNADAVHIDEAQILLEAQSEAALPAPAAMTIQPGMILELELRFSERPEGPPAPPPPPGPSVPDLGSVSLEDVTVLNAPSRALLPEATEPEEPPRVDSNAILFALSEGRRVQLPELPESEEFSTVRIPVSEYVQNLEGLELVNRNTHRDIEIRSARVFDPEAIGEYEPLNPLRTAQDARLRVEGIEVTRSSNRIDDIIPGTTLNLHRPSAGPVEIAVEPDRESAKDAVIEFVAYYNQLIRDINILTRSESEIIDQIEYFSDEEREQARERLGLLQGDSTLNQLRTRLQTIVMNAYDTGPDSDLRLLAQIGISSNAGAPGRGFDPGRLRGYLEINENILDNALANNFEEIRRLFGSDTDGDRVIDSGVGYTAGEYIRGFTQIGGVVATRTSSIDTRITNTDRQIENYGERLDRREAELRREFSRMEGALQELEQSRSQIEGMNPNSGGGR
ncbi:MAG: flagellar hook protein FliD [Spirochaetaceae bacterium]|nr:MAG: flagellar hook protein FliD [Spirochaetaceae bacterium]